MNRRTSIQKYLLHGVLFLCSACGTIAQVKQNNSNINPEKIFHVIMYDKTLLPEFALYSNLF